jgi:hypothetical protein
MLGTSRFSEKMNKARVCTMLKFLSRFQRHRRGRPFVITLLLMLMIISALAIPTSMTLFGKRSAADAATSTSTSGTLRSAASNKCLDVSGLSTTNGTRVQIWDCWGGVNQQWTLLSNGELQVYGNKCLDVPNHATTAGTRVQIWDCNGGANQQWTLNTNGTIVGRESGLCLDVTGGGTTNGTAVQIWPCHGLSNQQWTQQRPSQSTTPTTQATAPATQTTAPATQTPAPTTQATAPATQTTSSGPVVSASGTIPSGLPHYFSFGMLSSPNAAAQMDEQRTHNGTSYAFRYQYLTGGVTNGSGWETWNQPAGQFATYYMQDSDQHGYIPAFVFYEIRPSKGPLGISADDYVQDKANLADPTVMKAYYTTWVLLLQKVGAFGKPTLIIVEPDLWGFLQSAAKEKGSNLAASVPASVSSSGYSDAAGYPNTAQGFAWALLHMRDKYAHNAILALHASPWGLNSDTSATLDVAGLAQTEANFLNSAGLVGNPAGVSSWDVLSTDVADRDAGRPDSGNWWDRYNRTFPNFARYLSYISALNQNTHRRLIMWQVPMGNQYFKTMNNTPGHYQDNKAEYILGNIPSFAAAGFIGVLFGTGQANGTANTDATNDGVTNPAPINTYECNGCNTHVSSYADDDGGYLRIFIGAYMKNPVMLS